MQHRVQAEAEPAAPPRLQARQGQRRAEAEGVRRAARPHPRHHQLRPAEAAPADQEGENGHGMR